MLPRHVRAVGRRYGWLAVVPVAALALLIRWRLGESTASQSAQDLDNATVPVTPEMAWVQPDAALFVTIRVGDLWRSADGKILREQFAHILADLDREAEREFGLRLEQIEQLTVVLPDWSMVTRGGRRGEFRGKFKDGPALPDIKVEPIKEIPKKDLPDAVPPAKDEAVPVALADEAAPNAQPPGDDDIYPQPVLILTATDPALVTRIAKEAKNGGVARMHKDKTYYSFNQ